MLWIRAAWLGVLCVSIFSRAVLGQAECNGWGEFRGIRVEGELIPFSTSVKLVGADGKVAAFSATQTITNPRFSRSGTSQTSTATIGNGALGYSQTVVDADGGSAKVSVQTTGHRDQELAGTYYFVTLPAADYAGGTVDFSVDQGLSPIVTLGAKGAGEKYVTFKAKGVKMIGASRQIEMTFENPIDITVQRDRLVDTDYVMQEGLRLPVDEKSFDRISISFPIVAGNMTAGQTGAASFTIKASGTPDKKPVSLALDWSHPGPAFDGVGGIFRIQSPQDQTHLGYKVENLRVAWGRVKDAAGQLAAAGKCRSHRGNNNFPALRTRNPHAAWTRSRPGRAGRARVASANTGVQQAMTMARLWPTKKFRSLLTWGVPQWALKPRRRQAGSAGGIQGRCG